MYNISEDNLNGGKRGEGANMQLWGNCRAHI